MALLIQETVHRGRLRDFAKTAGSQDYVALPLLLAEELKEWHEMARYSGEEDFIFPNSRGGFISKDNYLNRVLLDKILQQSVVHAVQLLPERVRSLE